MTISLKFSAIILLITLSLHSSAPAPQTSALALQDSRTPLKKPEARIIEGKMFLIPKMHYIGNTQDSWNNRLKYLLDANQQPLKLNPHDTVIEIWATSQESENWSAHGHPTFDGDYDENANVSKYSSFPDKLPLSMIDKKNEGDFLTFQVQNPTSNKIYNVKLCCKQQGSRYSGSSGETTFQIMLTAIKQKFIRTPSYNLSDIELLLNQGILIENPTYTQLEELENQLSALPANTLECPNWEKFTTACTKKRELLATIAQIKTEWLSGGNALGDFGNIPELFHGPNGFKLSSAVQPHITLTQHSSDAALIQCADTAAVIPTQSLPLGKPATQPDEMD